MAIPKVIPITSGFQVKNLEKDDSFIPPDPVEWQEIENECKAEEAPLLDVCLESIQNGAVKQKERVKKPKAKKTK